MQAKVTHPIPGQVGHILLSSVLGEFDGSKTIELIQSIDGTRGDVTL